MSDLLNKSMPTITGQDQDLSAYKGQVILAVNTASKCGFTGQYSGLEEIYQQYKDQGFVILGFPSNDFGGQEPGSDSDVQSFCQINYGVSFPLFSKSGIKKDTNPFFKDLIAITGKKPKWNFNKYLIARDGESVTHFGSFTKPNSGKVKKAIEALL